MFRPTDAERILSKAHAALSGDGILLLEPSPFDSLKAAGERGRTWFSASSGLFSDQPHLCLTEHLWDAGRCVVTTRFFIVGADGDVTRHAQSMQAYTDDQYRSLLADRGYGSVELFPSLTGAVDNDQRDTFAIVARKRAAGAQDGTL